MLTPYGKNFMNFIVLDFDEDAYERRIKNFDDSSGDVRLFAQLKLWRKISISRNQQYLGERINILRLLKKNIKLSNENIRVKKNGLEQYEKSQRLNMNNILYNLLVFVILLSVYILFVIWRNNFAVNISQKDIKKL